MIEIAARLEDPKVWDDPKAAQELGREKKQLEAVVEQVNDVTGRLRDAEELFGLAREENDDDTLQSAEADVQGLDKSVAEMEFRRMFSNPLDPNPCFVDIQAGAGGTEAQDWAEMLERMYLKYCDKKGFKDRKSTRPELQSH